MVRSCSSSLTAHPETGSAILALLAYSLVGACLVPKGGFWLMIAALVAILLL